MYIFYYLCVFVGTKNNNTLIYFMKKPLCNLFIVENDCKQQPTSVLFYTNFLVTFSYLLDLHMQLFSNTVAFKEIV